MEQLIQIILIGIGLNSIVYYLLNKIPSIKGE